jgi:hypothetical protein
VRVLATLALASLRPERSCLCHVRHMFSHRTAEKVLFFLVLVAIFAVIALIMSEGS